MKSKTMNISIGYINTNNKLKTEYSS